MVNVGLMNLERGHVSLAIRWFRRAIQAGDRGADFEILCAELRAGRPVKRLKQRLRVLIAERLLTPYDEAHARALLKNPTRAMGKLPSRR